MKPSSKLWILFGALVIACVLSVISAPKYPVALVRVVDAAGKPVAGAVITPEGLRTKPGPYVAGWYSWPSGTPDAVPNPPVTSDKDGWVSIPYPKFVFERIETGTLCLRASHPDFVSDRPERIVATKPPDGAPLNVWADYVWGRIQHKALVVHTDPIILKPGAILKLSVRPGSPTPGDTPLFAQVTGAGSSETNFWLHPEPGTLLTRRLGTGTQMVRAVQFDAKGAAWFSDTISITAAAGQTNEVVVDLTPGITLRGKLDATVPRPVKNGRVIVQVTPPGHTMPQSPPEWHSWATIGEDGNFEIGSLPQGELEVVALCNGYVSTNGPGKYNFHYPQTNTVSTNDLAITIGMEPTARLEVLVLDDHGKPLPGAKVMSWPNVRYGEWAAVILAGDCYNTADVYLSKTGQKPWGFSHMVTDFEGESDASGVAVIPNLPLEAKRFAVDHPHFALPAVAAFGGQKNREVSVNLTPGTNNRITITLEPKDQSPITHY